jgi:DNA-binding XRE family transcriptional regulator
MTTVEQRCRRLRIAIEGEKRGSQLRFAKRVGLEMTAWNNAEKGYPLSIRVALKLVHVFHGLSLDWLYLGRAEGLSSKMFDLLGEGIFRSDR